MSPRPDPFSVIGDAIDTHDRILRRREEDRERIEIMNGLLGEEPDA